MEQLLHDPTGEIHVPDSPFLSDVLVCLLSTTNASTCKECGGEDGRHCCWCPNKK